MKIVMIGAGYVGLVSGTCFAQFGFDVTCVDTDPSKIDRLHQGIMPIYEAGLEDMVAENVKAGRLHFSTDLKTAIVGADAAFIAVGTPRRHTDGHADLSYVYQAAKDIAEAATGYIVIVTKSTVPVGTAAEVERITRDAAPNGEFDICSNPEFLREGAAINDFMRPDKVVIGSKSERARKVMDAIYRPLFLNETPIVHVDTPTAEMIKYANNAFLATKITFINEIADLCEKTGADVQKVSKAMGMDGRIGGKFLNAGPGYGGSCFPKDTIALTQTGRQYGAPQRLVETVIAVNNDRKVAMAYKIIAACGGDVRGKKIGILGIAFKPETDDIRDAPALTIIPLLQHAGAIITAHDPQAVNHAQQVLTDIEWVENPYDVALDADAVVVITEWNTYRGLNLQKMGELMKNRRLIDLRNIYTATEAGDAGFAFFPVGKQS